MATIPIPSLPAATTTTTTDLTVLDQSGTTKKATLGLILQQVVTPSLNLSAATPTSCTWLVDSNAGNDANDGKTAATAFKTLTHLLSVLANGQRVGLAANSIFREDYALTGFSNVTTLAYGSGTLPQVRGDDVQPNANFTATGGQPNVYQITATATGSTLSGDFGSVWENGTQLLLASSLANCSATAGTYFYTTIATTYTLFIHASDSSSIPTNGKTYEAAARENTYNDSGSMTNTVRNVWFRRSLSSPFLQGTAVGCYFTEGNKHNLLMRSFSTATACTFAEAYYAGQAADLVAQYTDVTDTLSNTPDNLWSIIEDCDFYITPGLATAAEFTTGAQLAHTDGARIWGAITIRNTNTTNLVGGITFAGNQVLAGLVEGCDINCGNLSGSVAVSVNVAAGGTATIRSSTLIASTVALTDNNGTTCAIYIDACNIIASDTSFTGFPCIWIFHATDFSITNSTITSTTGAAITFGITGCRFTSKANTFTNNNGLAYAAVDLASLQESSGNLFVGAPTFSDSATNNYTLAQWQALTGQDGNQGVATQAATWTLPGSVRVAVVTGATAAQTATPAAAAANKGKTVVFLNESSVPWTFNGSAVTAGNKATATSDGTTWK